MIDLIHKVWAKKVKKEEQIQVEEEYKAQVMEAVCENATGEIEIIEPEKEEVKVKGSDTVVYIAYPMPGSKITEVFMNQSETPIKRKKGHLHKLSPIFPQAGSGINRACSIRVRRRLNPLYEYMKKDLNKTLRKDPVIEKDLTPDSSDFFGIPERSAAETKPIIPIAESVTSAVSADELIRKDDGDGDLMSLFGKQEEEHFEKVTDLFRSDEELHPHADLNDDEDDNSSNADDFFSS